MLAGTIAALCQAGVLMLAVVGAYKINQSVWGGILDMLLDIPADVIVTYALFGLGGVLFIHLYMVHLVHLYLRQRTLIKVLEVSRWS